MRPSIKLLLITLLASPASMAEIYTWTDNEGNQVFSDQPEDGATEIKLPPPQTYSPAAIKPALTSPAAAKKEKDRTATSYQLLAITQPLHDQALWSNSGQVDIVLAIEPDLATAQGHQITLNLDGKVAISKASTPRLSLKDINRGSHTLSAAITDHNGATLIQSKAVTFHVHRRSILRK